MRERTIKVSEGEWKLITQARNVLMHRGYNYLPKQIQEGYKTDEYTKGAIVGLGIIALLYLLEKQR